MSAVARSRLVVRLVLPVVLALFAAPAAASAHAYLVTSAPSAGATVTQAPAALRLTFTEGIEPAFSTIELRRGDATIPSGPPTPIGGDAARILVALKSPLEPGTYTVVWHVTAVDTHQTAGTFTFTVAGR